MKKHLTRPFKRIGKSFTLLNPLLRKIIPGYKKLPQRLQKTVSVFLLITILIGLVSPISPLFDFFNKKADAAWWNDNWSYRRQLTIDNSASSTTLTNFPILVTLNSSRIDYNYTQNSGQDIRFTDCYGQNVYSHEIEVWDENGTSYVWVKIPTMLATTSNCMYVYYGNPSATDGQRIQDVWSNGYSHVYHFANSGGTNNGKNSVNNSSAGTTFGAGYTDAAGKIGRGFANSTNNTPFQTTDDRTGSTAITVEAWIQPPGTCINWTDASQQGWVGNGWAIFIDSSCRLNFGVGLAGAQGTRVTTSTVTTGTINNYIVGSYDTNGDDLAYAYINGTASGAAPTARNNAATDTTSTITNLVNDTATMDEFRISNVQRSADWIAAQYKSMSDTLIGTYGSAEKSPAPVGFWKLDEGTGTSVNDSMGISSAGTLSNSPTWQNENMCISGKCLLFTGASSQSISITDADNPLRPSGKTLTVSAWYKRQTTSSTGTIAQKGASGASGWTVSIGISPCSANEVKVSKLGVADICLSGVPADTNWHAMSVVYDTTGQTLYIDGVAKGTSNNTTDFTATTSNLTIGYGDAGGYFSGFIDELKIYDYARTAAQVKVDYNSIGASSTDGNASVLGANSQNSPNALSSGLTGYWKVDDNTGVSAVDSSGNAQTGTLTGNTAWTSGKFGSATVFDGTGDYVSMANTTSLQLVSGDFTVSYWHYMTTNASCAIPFNKYNSSTASNELTISYNCAGSILVTVAGNAVAFSGNSTLTTNTWQFITLSRKGDTTTLYINGVSMGSTTGLTGTTVGTGALTFGASDQGGQGFVGRIDEVRTYKRTLSGNEVSQLYNWAPTPVAYYDFETIDQSNLADKSGNGNNGSWSGSTTSRYPLGKYGRSGTFNGSNDVVTVANSTSLQVLPMVTASAWVYIPTGNTTDVHYIMDKWTYTAGDFRAWSLNLDTDGTTLVWRGSSNGQDGGAQSVTTSYSSYFNKWTYIAGTYDGTNLRLYINGALVGTTALSSLTTTSQSMYMGAGNNVSDKHIIAKIDEARVYNYARTPAQITADMNASHPPGGSPIGSQLIYLKFDEGYGTVAYNSGNQVGTFTGALNSSTWTNAGKMGKALNYGGSAYTVITTAAAINFNQSDSFSFSVWVRPTSLGSQQMIFDKQGSTTNELGIRAEVSASNKLRFSLVKQNVGTSDLDSLTTVTSGTWYHLVGVSNGTTQYLYVNGNLEASGTIAISSATQSVSNLFIGQLFNNTLRFNGDIDEFKVYNGALTADQIKIDYNRNASQVLGATGDNSTYQPQAANQEFCVPGDSASCVYPVARWDLEEASGTTAQDSSGNGNTGTITAGTGSYTIGKWGGAYRFDGADTVINAGSASSLDNLPAAGMTLEAWIYPTGMGEGSAGFVMAKNSGTTPSSGWIFGLTGTNAVTFTVDGSTDLVHTTSSNAITLNTWNHLVLSWDGVITTASTAKIYVNGSEASYATTTNGAARVDDASSTFYIGNDSTSARTFAGKIDAGRVFNYARSAAQIAQDYNKGLPVGWWKSDDCQGTTLNDASGNSMSAAITIGGTGTYTSAGSCGVSSASSAWYNGRNGKINSSLAYDGTDDYAEVTSNTKLDSTAGTWAGWIKTSQGTSSYYMIMQRASNTSTFGISIFQDITTGKVRVQVKDSSSTAVLDLTGGTAINNGAWHHFALTFNGTGTGYLYIDGKLATSGTPSGSWSFGANNMRFADAVDAFWSSWTGQLDDLRVYNYPMTANQIKMLYNNGATSYLPVTGAP